MSAQFLQDTFGLRGQTAIVTGGTGGLGCAMAVALVKAGVEEIHSIEMPQDPGSSSFKKHISEAGGKVISYECDLQDTQSIRKCFQNIWDTGLVPDIQLNCAGVMKRNLCEDVTDGELNLLVDVNFKAYFVCTQEFGRRLLTAQKSGRIINIASVTSYQAGFNTSVYSSTKGAVLQMTKAFSNEWSSKGIQVNCIAPGFMMTSMTSQYRDDDKMTDYLMARVPMARWGKPEDLQAAVLFLAAPGNKFTTGACLVVDGGFCGK